MELVWGICECVRQFQWKLRIERQPYRQYFTFHFYLFQRNVIILDRFLLLLYRFIV